MATMTSICWGFSNIAFDASKDDHFPDFMQRGFGFWGHYWFSMAMLYQGDAMRFWCAVWDEAAKEKRKPPPALTRDGLDSVAKERVFAFA
jgi:hypothetical protein